MEMSEITLSFDFIDKYVRFAKPEYIQVFIYIKYCVEKGEKFPTAEEISKALDLPAVRVEFILEYWASRGEISFSDGKYAVNKEEDKSDKTVSRKTKKELIQHVRSMKPAYSQTEIDAVATANKQISTLFYQAEKILNKVLTASDMELLFSFNDWLGLPVEVILMLLSYAAKRGKTTKRYLETVAIDWAEKGIDTFEAAEAYAFELEAIDSAERQVKKILGIYDRGLTATERKYIKLWVNEMKIPSELISEAYDRTVEYTGKLSWSYMDKMLQSWMQNGFNTVDDVKAADEEFYRSNGSKDKSKKNASKLNNYEDGNNQDYAELEEQILEMMLDND